MDIGKRIKQRRKDLHMSVDELAKRLGKNRATVYRYEKGDIENLPMDILEPLAIALDTTPQYLMGWTEELTLSPSDLLTHKDHMDYVKTWYSQFGVSAFTEEERNKIFEYAKFLLSQRENK